MTDLEILRSTKNIIESSLDEFAQHFSMIHILGVEEKRTLRQKISYVLKVTNDDETNWYFVNKTGQDISNEILDVLYRGNVSNALIERIIDTNLMPDKYWTGMFNVEVGNSG